MVELRLATWVDADAVAAIHIAARLEAMPYLPELHSEFETLDWITNSVLPQQDVWVAKIEGRLVGYAAVDGFWLNDLYIAPVAQGQGVGSALLRKAQELSPAELSLWTFQRNEKARSFYQHRGFRAVEFGNGSGNEEGEPDVRYHWTSGEDPPQETRDTD